MRISDWSSDVCSSDLHAVVQRGDGLVEQRQYQPVLEVPGHLVVLRHLGLLRLALGPGVQALAVLLAALARLGWGGQRGRDFEAEEGRQLLADAGGDIQPDRVDQFDRSEEHTSELQSLMRISYAV